MSDATETIDGLLQANKRLQDELDPEKRAAVRDKEQDTDLKKSVANFSMKATATQAGVADLAFLLYAISQWGNIPVAAIDAWLAAAVVQIVGLMAIVSHYLFPRRDA